MVTGRGPPELAPAFPHSGGRWESIVGGLGPGLRGGDCRGGRAPRSPRTPPPHSSGPCTCRPGHRFVPTFLSSPFPFREGHPGASLQQRPTPVWKGLGHRSSGGPPESVDVALGSPCPLSRPPQVPCAGPSAGTRPLLSPHSLAPHPGAPRSDFGTCGGLLPPCSGPSTLLLGDPGATLSRGSLSGR